MLERGPRRSHGELIDDRAGLMDATRGLYRSVGRSVGERKPWRFAAFYGGSSNLWFGNTPRMLAEDFELQQRYGVGWDWPIGYDDLAPYYDEAETLMAVAGPTRSPQDRGGRPYPQPAHALSLPEQRLLARHGDDFFPCPSARASVDPAGPGARSRCCASYVCNLCPVDAKFTVQNGMAAPFADPRVELRLGARVQAVDHGAGVATGVHWREGSGAGAREQQASGALIALGANALFNAHILLRSGLESGPVGRYLHEQAAVTAVIDLEGVDNFQGSTSCTGLHYRYARGPRRREQAAVLLETYSSVHLRLSPGRWRQAMVVTGIFETLPDADSRVTIDPQDPERPLTEYRGPGDYCRRSIVDFAGDLERMLDGLPISDTHVAKPDDSLGHILGTARMGVDPESSVVDGDQIHHGLRNLLVLGGSSFPSGAPARPTLTIAALSLRSARRLLASSTP
ncbi:MAG: GMC family oxidoreductase [Myxococcales bacterium]|nr:GMC family oxidoreductase [Myxococcales bacterium]